MSKNIVYTLLAALTLFGMAFSAITLSYGANAAFRAGRVENTTIATTTISQPAVNSTRAFQNGNIVVYTYQNYMCTPAIYNTSEAKNASSITTCQVGSSFGANIIGAIPIYAITPSFAGLSAYTSSQASGYSVYNGSTIATQCGVGNSVNACAGRPKYFYSPLYSMMEASLGTTNGMNGLPQGVFPNSARDFIMPLQKNSTYSKSYIIRVQAYDPNIYPNATTGKCKQIAPSSLANPTANCLTSVSALAAALTTTDNAVATINANNIVWQQSGKQTTQAVILLITQNKGSSPTTYTIAPSANMSAPNTDQTGVSFISAVPAATTTVATTAATTAATTTVNATTTALATTTVPATSYGSSNTWIYIVAVVVVIIIIAAVWMMMKGKK